MRRAKAAISLVSAWGDAPIAAGLALAAGISRLGLWSTRPGEPDSARYLIGMEQWLAHGPRAVMIYNQALSTGYYRIGMALGHFAGSLSGLAGWLNGVSVLAATATAPLAYLLGRRWLGRGEALAAAAIWSFSPGIWWLGIEPHPQGPAIACGLLALWAAARSLESFRTKAASIWWLAGMAAFTAALLLKSDLLLLLPAFPALAIWRGHAAGAGRRWLAALLPGAAIGFSLAARNAMVGISLAHNLSTPSGSVAEFFNWPRGSLWVRQLLPVATSLGLGAWLLIVAGLGLSRWRRRQDIAARAEQSGARPGFSFGAWKAAATQAAGRVAANGRLLMLLSWGLPGLFLWLLIAGNNTRHAILFALPWLWVGCHAWRHAFQRLWVPGAALAAALALNWIAIPANSNITLYPSANVPRSFTLLARQQRRMRRLAAAISAAAHSTAAPAIPAVSPARTAPPRTAAWPVCYLGWYSNPYLEYDLLRGGRTKLERAGSALLVEQGRSRIAFLHVRSSGDFARAGSQCRRSYSLEYGPRGRHRWFLGEEWRRLPYWRRWYPGGRAPGHELPAAAAAMARRKS